MVDTRGQSAGNSDNLAWLAGFLDGEGCISLVNRMLAKTKGGKRYLMIQPSVQISNTHFPTMERIYEMLHNLGVGAWMRNPIDTRPRHKPLKTLQVVGQKRVLKLLKLVTPYLYTKRRQAELVIEFIESRFEETTGRPYTDRDVEIRDEVTKLNKRGSSQTDTLSTET